MSPLLLSLFFVFFSLSLLSPVVMASEAWPEPASSILSQIQEAEREYLAAAATGNSNDPCRPISPCKNGGTCISEAGGFFYCACTESFIGRDCGFAAPNANTNSLFNLESAEKQPKVMHVQGVRSRVAAVANAAAAAASASSSSSSSTTTDNNNNSNRNMNVQSAGSVSSSDDYCSRFSPCLHGGICQSITGGYKCICKPGWVGHDCALALDANVWQPNNNNANTKQ